MPHIVTLNLKACDFRQHPAVEESKPHWLREAVYGRHLLKTKLRQMRPDLQVLMMREQPEHEQLLETMVDVLDLRDWPKPTTIAGRLKAAGVVLRMALAIEDGRQPPRWQEC